MQSLTKPLTTIGTAVPYVQLPIIEPLIEQQGNRVTFNFNSTRKGFKISYAITWNSDASLMKIRLVTTDSSSTVATQQQAKVLANTRITGSGHHGNMPGVG